MPRTLCLLACVLCGLALPIPQAGEPPAPAHRSISSIPVLKRYLAQSPYHMVHDTALIEGPYYRFTIRCNHGVYEALSIRELFRITREIDAVEHFNRQTTDPQHLVAMKDSATELAKGAGHAVTSPVDSATSAGSGAARSARGAGRFFARLFGRHAPEAPTDAPAEGIMGKERRRIAAQLGVDVYSTNPRLQLFLTDLAKQRLMGRLPVELGVLALPGGGLLSLSLAPSGPDAGTEALIRECTPDELRRTNALRYEKELLFDTADDGSPVRRLLRNPAFTPRRQTALCGQWIALGSAENLSAAIAFAADSPTPEIAAFRADQVELLSLIHQHMHRLRRLSVHGELLGAVTLDGEYVAAAPFDIARAEDPDAIAALEATVAGARREGARRCILFLPADAETAFVQLAKSRECLVLGNLLLDPRLPTAPVAAGGAQP